MKIDVVVVYVRRYQRGHEKDFVPPVTGIHLAAITPARHQVRVIHQQVESVSLDTDADVVALSFFSGFAPEAYRLANEFRARGKLVVAGGPHATFSPDEALQFCDGVVIGEAESVWEEVLDDIENGTHRQRYSGKALPMDDFPTPRYDLLPSSYFVPRVIQATRGCPFQCSFCTVPTLNPGFRVRPVESVLEDIRYDKFKYWWQRKIVWFWDDNLTIKRPWIRELLKRMKPLKRWWLTQASMDIAKDNELLDLMKESGCIGVFFGVESFGEASLKQASKQQNRVDDYRRKIEAVHQRGICVMGGFIAGFDADDSQTIRAMAKQLYGIGIDVPFLSILTPFRGTPDYKRYQDQDRLLEDRGWEHYNGFNVAFQPAKMSPEELLEAHRALWREAFSWHYCLRRIFRAVFRLRLGALLMCTVMNLFYGWKRMCGNEPMDFSQVEAYPEIYEKIAAQMHPVQQAERVELTGASSN